MQSLSCALIKSFAEVYAPHRIISFTVLQLAYGVFLLEFFLIATGLSVNFIITRGHSHILFQSLYHFSQGLACYINY